MSEIERVDLDNQFERLERRLIPMREAHGASHKVLVALVDELGHIAQAVCDDVDKALFKERMEKAFRVAGFDAGS